MVTTIPIQSQRKRDWSQLYRYRVRGRETGHNYTNTESEEERLHGHNYTDTE